MCPFNSVWSCTLWKFGFTPPNEYARARFSTFGAVRGENLALRPWAIVYVAVCSRLGLYAPKTCLYAPDEYARTRLSPFGPLRHEDLALCPKTSVHVPVRSRLGPKPDFTPTNE